MRVEVTASPAEDVASPRSSRRRQPVRPEVKKEESDQDEEGEEDTKSKQEVEATTYVYFSLLLSLFGWIADLTWLCC